MHDYDRAWCMCAALAFLRKADEEEQRFFEDYRPQGMIQVKSRLDNEQWVKNLFHEDENLFIGKIFEMIAPAALVAKIAGARRRRSSCRSSTARFQQDPATSHRHVREDVRLGGAGARHPAARALRAQRRARRARRGAVAAAGVASRVRRCSPASRRRSSRSSSASTSRLPRRALHQEPLPDARRAEGRSSSPASRSSQPEFAVPAEMAQAGQRDGAELAKYMQPVAARRRSASSCRSSSRTAPRRTSSAGCSASRSRRRARASSSARTSRSRRRSSPPSRSSRAIFRRRRS